MKMESFPVSQGSAKSLHAVEIEQERCCKFCYCSNFSVVKVRFLVEL